MTVSDGMLEQALIRLADLMADCRDPWCVFGGAAMRLHGYRDMPIADIDVLVSPADGERLIASKALENVADGGTGRFCSRILLHPDLGALPVEILAGFEIFTDGSWQEVRVGDRIEMKFGAATVFIADIDDIARIFRLSGRPKDLARLTLLEKPAGD
ncbi:hypothetical protein KX729_05680 [Rhizobium sp. XQZ8]|uniref:hypothetical protein n=1 Tax=Rhizobium populisoli TaxID=2859785 RepID=UPI001CA5EA9A|nr:hypothetical protein [Rhizobium populisoli]MBW6420926.1 hypothetical protein [Rhizobium populisoli]